MNFLDVDCDLEASDFTVIPFPYEKDASWIEGSSRGSSSIIEASHEVETYDMVSNRSLTNIHTSNPVIYNGLEKRFITHYKEYIPFKDYLAKVLDVSFPIILGGDHSITPHCVSIVKSKYTNLSVLHLDAHADLRYTYNNSKDNHACTLRRVRELVAKTLSYGVRSMSLEEYDFSDKFSVPINKENTSKSLTENIYLTIDCDVFDPSFIRSVGTPVPGGFTSLEDVFSILKHVVHSYDRNIVCIDIVELTGRDYVDSFTIATLIFKLMCLLRGKND